MNPSDFWTMTEITRAIGGMSIETRRGTITFRRRYDVDSKPIGWAATAASVSGRTNKLEGRSRRYLLRTLYRWMKCN